MLARASRVLALVLSASVASLIVACGGDGDGGGGGGPSEPATVTGVEVTPETSEITVGEETSLEVTVQRSDGSSGPASGVSYSVSDPAILEVSGDGVVTGLSEGTAQIVAEVGGVEGTTEVTVAAEFSEDLALIDSVDVRLVSTEEQRMAGEYRFLGASADDFEVGSVILGVQGGGFLRRVTGVEMDGDTVVVSTEFAALSEVVRGGTFEATFTLDPGAPGPARVPGAELGAMREVYSAPGVVSTPEGVSFAGQTLFNQEVCSTNEATGAKVCGRFTVDLPTGEVSFAPEVTARTKFTPSHGLTEFELLAGGDITSDVSVRVTAAVPAEVKGERVLLKVFERPIKFVLCCIPTPLGPVPIPIPALLRLEIVGVATARVDLEGSVTSGASGSVGVTAGARYEGGRWNSVFDPRGDFESHPLDWDADIGASVRFDAKPVISLLILSQAGPTASAFPWVDFAGKIGVDDCSYEGSVTGGVDMDVGFKVEMLGGDAVKEYKASVAGPSSVLYAEAGHLVEELFAVGGEGQEGEPGEKLPIPLEVLVVNSDVEPSEGIEVVFEVADGSGSVSPASAVTDATGQVKAVWTLGPDEGTHEVTARTPDCEGANDVVFTAKAVAPEEEIPMGRVTGSVALVEASDVTSLEGATVTAEVAGPAAALASTAPVLSAPVAGTATTDENGIFVLELEPGSYTLTISHGSTVTTRVYQVDVTDGGTTSLGLLQVVRTSASSGTLDISVLRMPSDGFPVPDAQVTLRSGIDAPDTHDVVVSGTTGGFGAPNQGFVSISGIPAGTYTVRVQAPGGGVNREVTVAIGGETLNFTIYVHP